MKNKENILFKSVEIWVLCLVLIIMILTSFIFGFIIRQELKGSIKFGIVGDLAVDIVESPIILKDYFKHPRELNHNRFEGKGGFLGDAPTEDMYLLLSRYDGDTNEPLVELVNLTENFQIVHTWNPDLDALNDEVVSLDLFKNITRDENERRAIIGHPLLLSDGSLVFHNATPLRKIDFCSNSLWQNTNFAFHHSISTDVYNNIISPVHLWPKFMADEYLGSRVYSEEGFLDDGIAIVNADGKTLYTKSVAQIFVENNLEYLLFATGHEAEFNSDPIHLNDIEYVKYDTPFFKKGDLFLSVRNQSMIVLYRPSTNKILNILTGPMFRQHDINILDDSRISIFNNNIKDFYSGRKVDGSNEILIYDFKTDTFDDYQSESIKKADLRTITQGKGDILPDGGLFVQESNYGRYIMFDAAGNIKWEYVNRASDGNVYAVGWSRLINTKNDVETVVSILEKNIVC